MNPGRMTGAMVIKRFGVTQNGIFGTWERLEGRITIILDPAQSCEMSNVVNLVCSLRYVHNEEDCNQRHFEQCSFLQIFLFKLKFLNSVMAILVICFVIYSKKMRAMGWGHFLCKEKRF